MGRTVCGARRGRGAAHGARPLHRRPRHQARHAACRDPALPARPCRDRLDRRERRHRSTRRRPRHHRQPISPTSPPGWSRACGPRSMRGPSRSTGCAMSASRSRSSLASDRYVAEDALDLIDVSYRPLPAVVDPVAALEAGAPVLHEKVGSNLLSDRLFTYGDPGQAFASAPHRISVACRYPRNTGSPMETYGVVAEYDPHEDAYDVLANFQGPFSIHAVIARALKVPGNRLRLRLPPDSGGSFGVKQGVAPYIVLIAAAARIAGRPVKWIEDRLEHLAASVSATNRVTTLTAAVEPDGRVTALDWDQIEDCGAYLRAPEPATLYRMHGNLTGAYDIRQSARAQPRRADQQDADRPRARLRRSAGLLPAGAADAAHRDRARARSARRDPPQPDPGRRLPVSHRSRRAVTTSGDYRPRARRRRTATAGSTNCRRRREEARADGPALRHRLHRRGGAQRLQHGLHHHRADGGGAPPRGPEERRAGDRDHHARSGRIGQRAGRLGAAGPGASHRAGAGRRGRVRPLEGRRPRHYRSRYAQGCLVDRVRQLFEPLRPGCRGRGAARRDRSCATGSRASPPRSSMCAPDDLAFAGGRVVSRTQPGCVAALLARRRDQPLVARASCRTMWGRRSARPCSGRRRN